MVIIFFQFASNGNDLQETVQRAITIANGVDAVSLRRLLAIFLILNALQIYRQLNIRVLLTSVITFTNGDQFVTSSNPDDLLDSFRSYVQNTLTDYDSAMLLT